jgi:hypothetical protein
LIADPGGGVANGTAAARFMLGVNFSCSSLAADVLRAFLLELAVFTISPQGSKI